MSNDAKPVETLVVDSSVLIRHAPLKDLTNTAYAVPGVVAEIKDENTRASLQVLPYEFKLKEASSDAIKFGIYKCSKMILIIKIEKFNFSYFVRSENW